MTAPMRSYLVAAMRQFLPPPPSDNDYFTHHPRMLGRVLINCVADTGGLPSNDDIRAALIMDHHEYSRYTEALIKSGMVIRDGHTLELSPRVIEKAFELQGYARARRSRLL